MKRYVILATSNKAYGELDQWLAYPITHYSFEAGAAEVDRLNNEVAEFEERGLANAFVKYELIPVSDELVGQWDERLPRRVT